MPAKDGLDVLVAAEADALPFPLYGRQLGLGHASAAERRDGAHERQPSPGYPTGKPRLPGDSAAPSVSEILEVPSQPRPSREPSQLAQRIAAGARVSAVGQQKDLQRFGGRWHAVLR